MYLLVVELKDFSAAHRLIKGYVGKCNHLHGHNYALKIRLGSNQLASDDLVIDFSVVRKICDQWVQSTIDHCTLVCQDDEELLDFLTAKQQKHFILAGNTTVECLAKVIFEHLSQEIARRCPGPFQLQEVEVSESKHCSVIYSQANQMKTGHSCGE